MFTPFKILCGIGLFAIFSSTISKNPSLPLLVTHLGGDQMAVGMVAGVSAFAGILFSLPAGVLSDRFGHRRMMQVSGIVFATAPFLYLIVSNIWQIAAIRFYHGLATAVFGPVAMAYVAELHQDSRGEKMGWFSTATLLGRFSAPAVGGVILAVSASESSLGYTALYLVCGGAGLIVLAAMTVLPAQDVFQPPTNKNRRELLKGLSELFANRLLMATCIVEAAILFAYGIYETFLPIHGLNAGLSTWEIGICISSQIITIAVSKPVLGKLSDRYGRPLQIIIGAILTGFTMAVLAFSFSFPALIAVSILLGLTISIVTSASAAFIADLSNKNNHGSAMGILGTVMDIGHTTGPIVGGILAVSLDLKISFLSGGLILFLCSCYFLFTFNLHR